jgi:gluconate 2-dehydrogenase alpha chain
MNQRVDAIVVGLGASGAVVATEMAKAGKRVVGLEKGPKYTPEDWVFKHDEIRYYARGAMVPHMASDPITWRPNDKQEAVLLPWATGPLGIGDPLHLPPSLGTGGGTIHWGGTYWRFREAEFRMRSAIIERFGEKALEALPEDTSIVDWPFDYKTLEPYYDKVEWELGISGQAGNIEGKIIPGGNRFEAPRSRDYPMPPLRQGPANLRFFEACQRLGYHPFPQAAAINSIEYNGRSACTYCGFCHGFPCHVGAKMSTQVATLPSGLATGNLEILPFSRVYRVERDATGKRATGVSYFDALGRSQTLEADLVVLGCYALENARLLLASGINENGEVGKYLMTHAFGWFSGLTPDWSNPFMGPLVAASSIEDFSGELIPDNEQGAIWGVPVISFPGDTQPIEAIHGMPPEVPRWGPKFKEWIVENFRRIYGMYSQTSNFPSESRRIDLDPKVKDRFGQPAMRMTHDWREEDKRSVEFHLTIKRRIAKEMGLTYTWEEPLAPLYHLSTHEVGVTRMGEDPKTSVVDIYGKSHECDRLYVIGGGQFPTYAGYNPTGTIQAMAYMTAEQLVK